MSEMIERAAATAWDTVRYDPGMPSFAHEYAWDQAWPQEYERMRFRGLFRAIVTGAIGGMREPSAAMLEGGGRAALVYPNAKWDDPHVQSDEAGLRTATVNTVSAVWEAMIDEALK